MNASMPFSVHIEHYSVQPPSSASCPLSLTTSLGQTVVSEGSPVDVTVHVENTGGEDVGMVVAVVGVPGGLQPRVDKLREMLQVRA